MALGSPFKSYPNAYIQGSAFERILSNARFASGGTLPSVIAVTSAMPDEGKSYVAQNLAKTSAESGIATLLVDCDLRKRSLAERLGVQPDAGIVAVANGEVSLANAVVPTKTDNLFFLDSETLFERSVEFLVSDGFRHVVELARERFELVVLDTSPLEAFVDAAEISRVADGTILVIRQNKTHRSDAAAAARQLKDAGARIVGCVLNRSDASEDGSYYSAYRSYRSSSRGAKGAKGSKAEKGARPTRPRDEKAPGMPVQERELDEIIADSAPARTGRAAHFAPEHSHAAEAGN